MRFILLSLLLALPTTTTAQDMGGHDVVLLGEVHDNGLHHWDQGDLIRQVKPKAVVFEMLTPAQSAILNDGPRGDAADLGARIDWATSGWPAYTLYQPIFEALGHLPVVGAAAPKKAVRRAFAEGAAVVFGPEAARFGLDRPVPEAQLATRKQMQFEAHCQAMPLAMMDGMVEAQRYRDAVFAGAVLDALETYGAPVVLIAGNGHVRRDWAVPALLAVAAPEVTTYAIGMVEAPAKADDPRFDHTIVTAAAERDDPCLAFKN